MWYSQECQWLMNSCIFTKIHSNHKICCSEALKKIIGFVYRSLKCIHRKTNCQLCPTLQNTLKLMLLNLNSEKFNAKLQWQQKAAPHCHHCYLHHRSKIFLFLIFLGGFCSLPPNTENIAKIHFVRLHIWQTTLTLAKRTQASIITRSSSTTSCSLLLRGDYRQ